MIVVFRIIIISGRGNDRPLDNVNTIASIMLLQAESKSVAIIYLHAYIII